MTTRVDPTRTTTLRKRFSAEMSRRFNRLKRAINQLIVVEDALGLRNDYFNPIQAIQGMATNVEVKYASTQVNIPYPLVQRVIDLVRLIDPQDLAGKGLELEPHITVRDGLHAETAEEVREFIEPNAPIEAELGGVGFFPGDEYDVLFVSVVSPDLVRLNRVLGKNLPHTDTVAHYKPHITIGYVKPGMGAKWTELLSFHPLNTVTEPGEAVAVFDRDVPRTLLRFNEVLFSTKERIKIKVAIPLLGKQLVMNTRWRFLTDEQQLEAFIAWLQVQIAAEIVTQGAESWLEKYIQKAYAGGMNRAFNDVKKPALWTGISPTESKLDFFEGTRSEFLRQSFGRPVATNRVKLLASRTFNDLRGVTDKMAAEIGRELVDGMILGLSPRDVARNMSERVDKIGKQRALVIARTECLPGDTLVDTAVVRAVFRRWYEGPMVKVVTSGGRNFSATPNHPMLTRRGWVAAGQIVEGDKLIRHLGQNDSGPSRNVNVDSRPTTLSEIFDTLNTVGIVERKASTKPDFHGDGMEGDVDVLRLDRELRIGNFAPLGKPVVENTFTEAGQSTSRFCSFCDRLLSVNEQPCLCWGSQFDSMFYQSSSYDSAIQTHSARNRGNRFLGQVASNDLSLVDVGSVLVSSFPVSPGVVSSGGERTTYPGLSENTADCLLIDPSTPSNLPLCETAQIKFDNVLSTEIYSFGGHVYNLETPFGYYTIDSLYTGNTVRAHNEGALDAMEAMGVEEVGVMVEWSTALDFKVCPECRPLQGVVLKTKEAHNMLPRHPNCRCSFIPANVGEDKSRQKRGKTKIEAAISASVRAEAPKKAQRQTIATLRRKSRWTGANKQIDKKRPRGVL